MESLTMYQTGTKGPASIVNILTYWPRNSIVHNKGLYQWLNLSLDLSKKLFKKFNHIEDIKLQRFMQFM